VTNLAVGRLEGKTGVTPARGGGRAGFSGDPALRPN